MHLRFGRTSVPSARAEDIRTSCLCSHTSFEPLRTPGTGGTQAQNKPARLAGGRKFASDPKNRRPRSLAALETTKLLSRVKQVGSPDCSKSRQLVSGPSNKRSS